MLKRVACILATTALLVSCTQKSNEDATAEPAEDQAAAVAEPAEDASAKTDEKIAAAVENFEAGIWEVTVTMQMPGSPMKMPPTTYKQCLTAEDMIPTPKQEGAECETLDRSIDGSTVSWTAACKDDKGAVASKSSGKLTFTSSSFDGASSVEARGMKMTSKMSGKRIGPCEG